MKQKIINYIEDLENKAKESDRFFKERNDALIKINKAIEYIDQVLQYHLQPFDYKQVDKDINTLIGILKGSDNNG